MSEVCFPTGIWASFRASRPRAHLAYAALAAVTALVQFRFVVLLFRQQYKLSVEAAQGVLAGEPHWQVFQSRLLGPWLVEMASSLFDSYLEAHVFCSVLLLFVAGYLMLVLLSDLYGNSQTALLAFFVHSFALVFCFNRPWLYIWDLVDLVVFVLFCEFVVRRRDWRYFTVLFVVAVFNRQSAFYIAGWMILDPVVRFVLDRARGVERARLDAPLLLSGFISLIAGAGLVEYLQRALLVREVGPTLVGEVEGAGPRFHFLLSENLRLMIDAVTDFRFAMSFLVPLFIGAFLVFCGWVAWRDPRRNLAIALIHAALIVSTLLFGYAFENRVYIVLMPFVGFYLRPAATQAGLTGAAP